MKKIQIGALTLVAALTIGGGAVYASGKTVDYKSVTVDGMVIESSDEELLKAIENGEVKIMTVDGVEDEGLLKTVEGIEIESGEEELLKAIENGEVKIMTVDGVEDEELLKTVEGIEIESGDEELLKAIEDGEVEVVVEGVENLAAPKAE